MNNTKCHRKTFTHSAVTKGKASSNVIQSVPNTLSFKLNSINSYKFEFHLNMINKLSLIVLTVANQMFTDEYNKTCNSYNYLYSFKHANKICETVRSGQSVMARRSQYFVLLQKELEKKACKLWDILQRHAQKYSLLQQSYFIIWQKNILCGIKHVGEEQNGNIFETFKASFVVLSIASVVVYKITSGGHVFKSILANINRFPLISSIISRAHTSFRNRWRPSYKQDG